MEQTQLDLFKKITSLPGVSGHEKYVAQALKEEYLKYTDEIIYDNLGSIFAVKRSKKPNAKKVMIAGHMDEVGFVVKEFTENGMIKIHPIGGVDPKTLLAHAVSLYTRDGKRYQGVIGSVPPHLSTPESRMKVTPIDDMYVDLGAKNKEHLKELGINIGDMIVLDEVFAVLADGKKIMAKAWDDRYGCILGIEMLKELQGVELDVDLYIGATVQEEVGCRGGQTAAQMIKPDIAIILDASPTNEMTPNGMGKSGNGILVRFMDASYIPNQKLLHYVQDYCDNNDLKWQYYLSMGGTDAGPVHKVDMGIPTVTMCVCSRYIHTCNTIIDIDDYETVKKVAINFVKEVNDDKILEYKASNR